MFLYVQIMEGSCAFVGEVTGGGRNSSEGSRWRRSVEEREREIEPFARDLMVLAVDRTCFNRLKMFGGSMRQ